MKILQTPYKNSKWNSWFHYWKTWGVKPLLSADQDKHMCLPYKCEKHNPITLGKCLVVWLIVIFCLHSISNKLHSSWFRQSIEASPILLCVTLCKYVRKKLSWIEILPPGANEAVRGIMHPFPATQTNVKRQTYVDPKLRPVAKEADQQWGCMEEPSLMLAPPPPILSSTRWNSSTWLKWWSIKRYCAQRNVTRLKDVDPKLRHVTVLHTKWACCRFGTNQQWESTGWPRYRSELNGCKPFKDFLQDEQIWNKRKSLKRNCYTILFLNLLFVFIKCSIIYL